MRNLAVVVAVAVLVSACGGSSDEGSASVISSVEATTTETTVATTQSTTTVPTTVSTTETPATEIAITDMERPELEVQTEWETDLDEIFGRYLMYWEALYNAGGPPSADPSYQPLLDLVDPGIAEAIQAQVQGFADDDKILIRPEGTLEDHGLRLPNPSVLDKTEGNRVVIQDCRIRDDITHFFDGRPNIESFKTILLNVTMVVDDGEWKYFGAVEADDRSDGYQECQDLFDTLEK